jgi:ribosomal-protein-alanine N-acetyltransferase
VTDHVVLLGRRVTLRPLVVADFMQWQEVRTRNRDWLTKWEPRRPLGAPDVVESRAAFAARCRARDRERQLGAGYGFGIFNNHRFCGEINVNGVQRGPFQSAYVGYWIDEKCAGQGFVPESVVVIARHAFEDLALHRLQIAIIPRNTSSRRVVEKLDIRNEGVAVRYLRSTACGRTTSATPSPWRSGSSGATSCSETGSTNGVAGRGSSPRSRTTPGA